MFFVNKFFNDSNRICFSPQNSSLPTTLNKMQRDDEIRIWHDDIGREVVNLNKNEYYSKLKTILKDKICKNKP